MSRSAPGTAGRLFWFTVLAVQLVQPAVTWADTINVGFISFDGFIPGVASAPGVNEFSINNFTGDASLGGFELPPDFPVLVFVTFKNAALTVNESSGNE